MMRYEEEPMLPFAISAALALALPGARLCSRIPDPLPPYTGSVHFIGVATADTVRAGAGAIRFRTSGGHFGPGTARTIHGQRVRVTRLGRTASDEVRRAVEAHGEVVLVPWDYGPDCYPVPWTRSARWMDAGTSGAFVARLRDRAHWVDGRPTLDVHAPQFVPYPTAPGLMRQVAPQLLQRAADGAHLSADELVDLYDVLTPLAVALPQGIGAADTVSLVRALDALLGWEREHAALAARYPARFMVSTMIGEATRQLVAARFHPEEGTYRVRVVLPSGDSSVFFFRTIRGAASAVAPGELRDPLTPTPRAPGARAATVGTTQRVVMARRLAELPASFGGSSPSDEPPVGYFGVLDSAEAGARRTQLYFGSAGRFVAADPVLAAAYSERPWTPGSPGTQDYFPARLTTRNDGTVIVAHEIARDGKPVAMVTATRVSREVARLDARPH